MTAVTVNKVEAIDELYCHYSSETHPQPCYVHLNLKNGKLSAGYRGGIGGIPEAVWSGRVVEWAVPCLTAESANTLMVEILPLAQRLIDDAAIIWDGRSYVGRLGPDASEANEEINSLCEFSNFEDSDLVTKAYAEEWIDDENVKDLGLTADTTDHDLIVMARTVTAEARTYGMAGCTVLVGAVDRLTALRDELREVGENGES